MTLRVGRADLSALITEPENALRLSPLLSTADCGGDLSVTWVTIDGRHRRLRTRRSTRLYVVIEGSLVVEADGEAPAVLGPGELAALSPSTGYAVKGTATYLVINAPGFVEGDDEYLET